MAEIVLGVGASHSTLMNTHWEQTADQAAARRYAQALTAARDRISAAHADVAVIIGSNHFRGFWLDLIPAFTVGVGECVASGESGTPAGPQPVDRELAGFLVDELVRGGEFEPAFSARLQIDHGVSHAIQYLLAGLELPIVPVVVNVFAHPLPSLARCERFGAALRVVVIGSGGLSHRLPWPDWRDPHGDDEEFMVRAWLDGRDNWQDYDVRRREIIRAARSVINPAFDEQLLALLEAGKGAQLADRTTEELECEAGNGGQEIRTWLAMAAATGHAPATRLAYEPMAEWLTGMAVATLEPPGQTP